MKDFVSSLDFEDGDFYGDKKETAFVYFQLPPSDQEHLVEVKHEFENLNQYDIGFIEKDKCSFTLWEYRPGI